VRNVAWCFGISGEFCISGLCALVCGLNFASFSVGLLFW